MKLNLLVRYCNNVGEMRLFYEQFGLRFELETHGDTVHFSTKIGDTVFELYPRPKEQSDVNTGINMMLGLKVTDMNSIRNTLLGNRALFKDGDILIVRDPEGGQVIVERES